MILDKKQTTIAYRCPECGCIVRGIVGIFSLSADMIKLKCPCGGSGLDIVYTKDKKVRLTVPCFVCPSPHSYLVSSDVFFSKDIFTIPCGFSGLDVCFIGSEDKIDDAIEASEKEIREIVGDYTGKLSDIRSEEERMPDPQVTEVIRYVLAELIDEGNINCRCDDGGEYELQFGDDSVFIVCNKCHAEYEVNAVSVDSANAFLNADEITLT